MDREIDKHRERVFDIVDRLITRQDRWLKTKGYTIDTLPARGSTEWYKLEEEWYEYHMGE